MAGIWDKMKSAGTKAKLQGEIVLHEREMKARKQRFGIELYDLLSYEKNVAFVVKTPAIFHHNEEQIKPIYQRCQNDVDAYEDEKRALQRELESVQSKKDRALPAFTARDKLNNAGQWVSHTGQEGKIQAQVVLLDRKIKSRKQDFGVEVYEFLEYNPSAITSSKGSSSSGGGGSGGLSGITGAVTGAVSSQLSKFSSKEKEIEACVEQAKKDVAFIERRIAFKQDQIVELGGTARVTM